MNQHIAEQKYKKPVVIVSYGRDGITQMDLSCVSSDYSFHLGPHHEENENEIDFSVGSNQEVIDYCELSRYERFLMAELALEDYKSYIHRPIRLQVALQLIGKL